MLILGSPREPYMSSHVPPSKEAEGGFTACRKWPGTPEAEPGNAGGRTEGPLQPLQGARPAHTWPPELGENTFVSVVLSPPVSGILLWQPHDTHSSSWLE